MIKTLYVAVFTLAVLCYLAGLKLDATYCMALALIIKNENR